VHIHGLWRLHYWQAARYARELRIPSVVSVHGMLYRQALAEHGGFKRLARWLYQDGVLQTAACLHATAADEIVEIRRLGFSKPIAMIPWGVDIPDHAEVSRIDQQLTSPRRTVLYFGRLHPRKGLDRLLHAWSRLARDGCRLVLAGGDADGYQSTLTSLASELGISDSVEWAGIRSGADRERLFANATVLVLPSAYENFGLVIPEALARGVPVIATHGAPWASLVEERCGWWIEPGVDALAAALSDALGRSGDELRAMGERGRRFAGSRFRWPCVSNAMCELYEWVLGAGPRPAFVDGRPS
jgi:glycosyltransferase involved in cell wall biosynthesis